MKSSQTLENGKADVSLLQELHRPLEGDAVQLSFDSKPLISFFRALGSSV
jgi:hypothetical protein